MRQADKKPEQGPEQRLGRHRTPRLRSLLRHPLRHWICGLEAALTLAWAKALLRLSPFRHYRRRLPTTKRSPCHVLPDDTLARIVWAVDGVSRRFSHHLRCLPRALAVQQMIRRRGGDASVRLGVAPAPTGGFRAHAWVELDGKVVIGRLPDLDTFAAIDHWPTERT
ncbi:MAG: lasso peptide biosynthesis B2 protein [Nannocystaceae bacterium]